MKVLIACERFGRVREAFVARSHDAWSCDVLPAEDHSPRHIQKAVEFVILDGWDLMIAHPPCTHLAVAGARYFKTVDKRLAQIDALGFFVFLLEAPIPRIYIENPVGIANTKVRKPDQIVQPYWFGDEQRKTTCLWLKGLPLLKATCMVKPKLVVQGGKNQPQWAAFDRGQSRLHKSIERSRTFPGIAKAMTEQWG